MAVDATRHYTLADVYAMPDDGQRYELVDGVLYVTPLARRRHQRVVMRLAYRLEQCDEANGGTVYPGVNVDLSDDTHLEPDVVWSRSEDTAGLAFTHAPDLVVEVSSPSTNRFDLGIKRERYAAEGTAEFWFVDLDDDSVAQFLLQPDGSYGAPVVSRRGDTLTSPQLPGLVVDVDDVLGPAET